ncbi:sigma-70 family RNA polymerase sigma factor [Paramicrobacterium chengjingii]|uniref:Sigma-70 family RNA polymerase sigma factor n=1 Tax=Paramicrobacterium chengjingii TaxID=2769067 RepID=A0ABX6YLP5_9MICO|nr:sigma-70 family RNA polymerase sigma factor [Microbacterium chengjingii]QPZ39255.1 sigma-70 family RNA polymerase sigma factor [Microbacterium chengjingii]
MSRAQASDASDANLLARTRDGDESAYAELWHRHSAAGLTVARSITSSLDHDDLVQESFVRVFTAVRKGGGPKGAFRPYLFTTLRNTAAEWGRKKRETSLDTLESFEDPSTTDAATEAALDRGLTATAYRSLPTRWQEVLWYSEVEQMTPAEIGPLLGMKANSVAALTYRAREGLRQAWIQAHINSVAEGSECRWTLERMGSYARSALGKRDTMRFDNHLDECAKCTIVVAEAKAVGSRIALVLLPLTIGATGASAYLAWLQSGQTAAVMAMPVGVAAGVGAPAAAGAGAAAAGGSGSAGSGGGGAGAGSSASGLSGGAIAVGGTVVAGVLAAAVAAAVIFIPALLPGNETNPTSPPQAASQPPAIDDPDEDAAPNDDAPEDAPPADEPPAEDYSPVVPPEDDPPADNPPVNEPPADDPDESTPPNEGDNETIAPDAPPAAPTDISVTPSSGGSDPAISGIATPGSTIEATAEPADTASTSSTGSSTQSLGTAPSTTSSVSPSSVPANLASPFTAAEPSASTLTFTTEADGNGKWLLTLDGLEPVEYSVTVTASINGRTSAPSAPATVSGPRDPLAITGVDADWVDDDQCRRDQRHERCLKFDSVAVNAPEGTNITIEIAVPGGDTITVSGEVSEGALAFTEGVFIYLGLKSWYGTTITVTDTAGDGSTCVDLRDWVPWWDWPKSS